MNRREFMSRVIGYDQNAVSVQYYNQLTESIFLPEGSESRISILTPTPASSTLRFSDNTKFGESERLFTYRPDEFVDIDDKATADCESTSFFDEFAKTAEYVVVSDATQLRQHVATNEKMTMIHIKQQHSYSPLQVTRSVFDDLLLSCGIFPQFKDSILYYGRRNLEVEVAPPRLRQRVLSSAAGGLRGFECAYGLRFIEPNNKKDGQKPWSLRQSAIYCRADYESQRSTWLFVSACEAARKKVDEYLQYCDEDSPLHPFDIHFLLVDTAVAQWRPYLVQLTKDVDNHTMQVLLASPDGEGPIELTGCGERQELKQLEDDISDMILSIDATLDTIASIVKCLVSMETLEESMARQHDSSKEFSILDAFNEKYKDVALVAQTARALRDKLQSTTHVVSSFLDLGNGYSLENLAKQAREENQKMGELAAKSTRDAAAVKVLTILTLVYLPSTVVSNFFSTSFVNQKSNPDATNTLVIAGNWWILVATSVPLTLLTLYVWWLWVEIQVHGKLPAFCRRETWSSFIVSIRAIFRHRKEALEEMHQLPR